MIVDFPRFSGVYSNFLEFILNKGGRDSPGNIYIYIPTKLKTLNFFSIVLNGVTNSLDKGLTRIQHSGITEMFLRKYNLQTADKHGHWLGMQILFTGFDWNVGMHVNPKLTWQYKAYKNISNRILMYFNLYKRHIHYIDPDKEILWA